MTSSASASRTALVSEQQSSSRAVPSGASGHNPESQQPRPELGYYSSRCIGCLECVRTCPNAAISVSPHGIQVDRTRCRVCGKCAEACPSSALAVIGKEMTAQEVLSIVLADRAFYDESGGGVTISGGEPLCQFQFAAEMARLCAAAGIHVVLDTSGYAPWEHLEPVAKHCALVLYDIKTLDADRHPSLVGASLGPILDNLYRITNMSPGPQVVLRYPLIPGANDTPADLAALRDLAAELDVPVELLPYHPSGTGKYEAIGVEPPAELSTIDARTAQAAAREWTQMLVGEGIQCSVK
ncbi:MAG: glycyl-radical enzyme activating protein [Armatimonadetes bacterium]|nr:glycyl-radical enzyme activating protein [Armatimonadota bacterium]